MTKVKDKKIHEARAFNFTYRYIDDVLSINNSRFAEFLPLIYPPETTDTASSASFLDLNLEFDDNGQIRLEEGHNSYPLVCRRPAETVSLQRRQICNRWGTPAYLSLVPRSSMFYLYESIHKAFSHRNYGSKFVVLGYNSTYFSNKIHKGKTCYSEEQVISMLEFLIDNIFVSFGGTLFQQVVGIPMVSMEEILQI
jgi:hypothetical protein